MQPELIEAAVRLPQPAGASPVWVHIYVAGCALMAIGCLHHAIKMGILEYESCEADDSRVWKLSAASTQVTILLFFGAAYWFLESWAHHRTPYYLYATAFPDLIGRVEVSSWRLTQMLPKVDGGACADFVRALQGKHPDYKKIPFSILLMESSITYVAMWVALTLRARYWVVPLIAGLFLLTVDGLLDPVVSGVYDCSGEPHDPLRQGLGFWNWYHPNGPPKPGQPTMANWYGVPLFNYGAWWGAPVAFISIAMGAQYLRGRVWRRLRKRPVVDCAPAGREMVGVSSLLTVAGTGYILVLLAKHHLLTPPQQWALFIAIIGITGGLVAWQARKFKTDGHADRLFVPTPLVFLGIALAAFLLEGLFLRLNALVAVGLFCLLLCAFISYWPYGDEVKGFAQWVRTIDRFIRVHSFGFTAMLTLIGAFSVALYRPDPEAADAPAAAATAGGETIVRDLTQWDIGGLLIAAGAFHVFAHTWRRALGVGKPEPLSREATLAVALVQPFVAGLAWILLRQRHVGDDFPKVPGSDIEAWWAALGMIAVAFLLVTLCGLWEKRGRVGFQLDVVQGLAWGCLALFAALIAMPLQGTDKQMLTWAIFGYGIGSMLLISGIHSRLRNPDCRTAIFLGVRSGEVPGPKIGRRNLMIFAFVLHTVMFALPGAILFWDALELAGRLGSEFRQAQIGVGILFLTSNLFLALAFRARGTGRGRYVIGHFVNLLLLPVLAFWPFLDGTTIALFGVCALAPLLAQEDILRGIVHTTHGPF